MPQLSIDAETLQLLANRKPLVRLLQIIGRYGKDGISTRRLLQQLQANELHRLILQAEKQGYIMRAKVPPEGKGNHLIYNRLSEKGQRLLHVAKIIDCG